jgi:hypothetical protein
MRLAVEQLEDRTCPTPVITSFMVSSIYHTTVTVMGTVTDEDPGSCWINISGAMTGSTMANAQGHFSYTATANSLGTVRAAAVDGQGYVSALASAQISSSPSTITNFTAVHAFGTTWIFQGTVTCPSGASGLIVDFGGLPSLNGQTTTVNSNGTFSLSMTLASGESGLATAQTTDWWGQESNVASYSVT